MNLRNRSLMYVNKRVPTSAHRQVQCPHPDVAAVRISTGDAYLLVFSIYIPPLDFHNLYEPQSMQSTLDAINSTIQGHGGTSSAATESTNGS
jgi:hypothetical protein